MCVRSWSVCALVTAALLGVVAALPQAAFAEGGHEHTPLPPGPGDVRFMPGTTGPTVFRGTAATVVIPDGPGFGGEKGRIQNSGDRRKNNYSVTDANFNNTLGLLAANPDTGAPLTYVQHIQTYAAAGFIETFAPDAYAHMVAHQDAGHGTVLGASAYLMGLVQRADGAAHGLVRAQIPAKLPGTDIDADLYVRATKDATGQQWARMHHAQTAPAVFKMLVDAGVNATTALILASDDGISGAGRINGVNEQDGTDGFNAGERATWALAAQVANQTGIPVVSHMMHGHDHAGIDVSAMTNPRINSKIGFPADAREATTERAAAIQAALVDGRVATSATAAGDGNLTVRNTAYLQNETGLDVGMEWFDYLQTVGTVKTMKLTVANAGPHAARDVMLELSTTANLQIVSVAAPPGVHCTTAHCHVGTLGPHWDEYKRELLLTVKFTQFGKSKLHAQLSTPSRAVAKKLSETHDHAAKTTSKSSLAVAAGSRGWKTARCGTRLARACRVSAKRGVSVIATVRPGRETTSGRWVKAVYFHKRGSRWVKRFDRWGQVDAQGRVRLTADRWRGWKRGAWRVQVQADATYLLGATASRYSYLIVR